METPDLPEVKPWESMTLDPEWLFEVERNNRLIDSITDLNSVKNLAKMFLEAWLTQKAAAKWAAIEASKHLTELHKTKT